MPAAIHLIVMLLLTTIDSPQIRAAPPPRQQEANKPMWADAPTPVKQIATNLLTKSIIMDSQIAQQEDSIILSSLNARFIRNFITQDAEAHEKIIHKNFVCIESSGAIVDRDTYLKNWATDFDNSGYASFDYAEESIRQFGNIALVRSKTIYTINTGKKAIKGYTIYTDTYLKENGQWKCVQVQITPVK